MFKKLISFFLSFALIICSISIPVSAEESNPVNYPGIIKNSAGAHSIAKNKQPSPKASDYKKQSAKILQNISGYKISGIAEATTQSFSGDLYEPNDDLDTAYPINFGTTYSSYIGSSDDMDCYKFTVNNTNSVNITLSNLPYKYEMWLINSNFEFVSHSIYDESTKQAKIDFDFNESGTYYLVVDGFFDDTYCYYSKTQKYSLKAVLQTKLSDPFEPNDTLDTAYSVNLGSIYESYIGNLIDEDYYKFNVTGTGSVNITLSNLPCPYGFDLYDSYGTYITSSVYDESTKQSVIDYDFNEPGDYYIDVSSYNYLNDSFDYSRTQKYSLKVTLQTKLDDPYEPNDNFDTACEINMDGNYESYIGTSVDEDYYKLNITDAASVNIILSNLPYEYVMDLYNSNREYISSSMYDKNTAQARLDYDFNEPGTYYIEIYSYDKYSRTQKYSLKAALQAKLEDPFEPNDTVDAAYQINLGEAYESYIGTSNDEDCYKFSINNPGSINITTSNLPYEYNTVLLNSNGDALSYSIYDEKTASSKLDYDINDPGTYYIEVYGLNSNYSRTQKYSLKAALQTKLVDPYEPNDSSDTAYSMNLGTVYQSYIGTAEDIDYYKFNVNSAGSVNVLLSNLPCEYGMCLLDSIGTIIYSVYDVSTAQASIDFDVKEPGTYYLAVYSNTDYSRTQKYSLTVKEMVNENPVISGATDKTIKVGDSFNVRAGVTATDREDGNLTSKIVVSGSVNTAKTGKYIITYTVTDSYGAIVSKSITVTVVSRTIGIVPLIGSSRYDTAVMISKSQFTSSDTVLIVNGGATADGLGATPLAAYKKAPLLLTATKSLPTATINEIGRLKAKKAIIVGGTGVVSDDVKNQLETLGLTVDRIWGSNRYGTSLEVAKYIDKNCYDVSKIVVSNGYGEADALSIASAAGRDNMPIILVEKYNVATNVYDWLKSESIQNAFIIGGTGVVSDNVLNKIDAITSGDIRGNRLGGQNRYETNALIIDRFYGSVIDKTYIAKGYLLIDALAAGSVVAINGSPVVLADKDLTAAQKTVLTKRYGNTIMRTGGGISDTAVTSLKICLQ